MAGPNIRKTKSARIGQAADERIRAIQRAKAAEGTSTQFGTAGQVGTGSPGGGGGAPSDPVPGNVWLKWDMVAADGGGTASVDLGLLADTGQVFLLYQIVRGDGLGGITKEIGQTHLGHDGTTADCPGPNTNIVINGIVDVSFAASIAAGQLRFTVTANGTRGSSPDDDARVRITYLTIPANS